MLLASVAAVAAPLAFLYLVQWLDLYTSGSFKTTAVCFGWGVLPFSPALLNQNFIHCDLRHRCDSHDSGCTHLHRVPQSARPNVRCLLFQSRLQQPAMSLTLPRLGPSHTPFE